MERSSLKTLHVERLKRRIVLRPLKRFAALGDLDAEVDVNRLQETIRDNLKISAKKSLSYYEFKKHKPWFDKEWSELLDQRKQIKLQWLQDPE
jgi:hypothetical protein